MLKEKEVSSARGYTHYSLSVVSVCPAGVVAPWIPAVSIIAALLLLGILSLIIIKIILVIMVSLSQRNTSLLTAPCFTGLL